MTPKLSNLIVGSSLTLLSLFLTTAASELVYRLYLMQKLNLAGDSGFTNDALDYSAINEVLTEFSLEFGYSYLANSRNTRVLIHDGYPVMCTQATTNELGNTNRLAGVYEDASLRILVFGDSFTANTDLNGITWPDLLQDELEAKLGQDVNVVNFGRGAYGILQMFDLARAKIDEFEPDLVIFAFITSDLVRARFWRTVQLIDGEERDLVLAQPFEEVAVEQSIDATVVNSMITQEWCEAMVATLDRDDSLLKALNDEFIRRRREHDNPIDFTSLSTSFLFNRIVYNDPLRGFTGPSLIPRFSESTFASDSRFIGNVTHINQSNIPYMIVHLPTYEDLKAGDYELSEQEQSLFASLQAITGKDIINFIDFASSLDTNASEDLDTLFLSPYDRHPSLQGIRHYAEVVSEILIAMEKEE